MKHTSGPWTLELGVEPGSWDIYAANAIVVAARNRWTHRADESNANARLIAAAPELLEALKRLLAASTSEDVTCECGGDTCKKAVAVARAAIAKAEGNG